MTINKNHISSITQSDLKVEEHLTIMFQGDNEKKRNH